MKFLKEEQHIYQDFKDYVGILRDSIQEVENQRLHHYKTMLFSLRALIGDTSRNGIPSLVRLNDKYNLALGIYFKGMEGIPNTNPLSKDRNITLNQYLTEEDQIVLNGKSYTIQKFVWDIASEQAVHPDNQISEHLALGESIFLGGVTANIRQTLSIARTILAVCNLAIDKLETQLNSN